MQHKVHTHNYSSQGEDATQTKELSFQNFLLLAQLKNENRLKQKQLQIQLFKELNIKMQNKIKIMPYSIVKSVQRYDSKLNDQQTSRRISMQLPTKTSSQSQLPKIKGNCHLQKLPHLKKQYRKDQRNAIKSIYFEGNPKLSKQNYNISKSKVLFRKFKTDFCNAIKVTELKRDIRFQIGIRKKKIE